MSAKIIVLKFGSSILQKDDSVSHAVHEVYRYAREGYRVIAVVSAISGNTDRLAARLGSTENLSRPDCAAYLLATGEQQAAALLTMALERSGIDSGLLDPREARLITEGDPLDAFPVSIDAPLINKRLKQQGVLVIPGFIGLTKNGGTALLGRGGSDLSALFIAKAVNAERCRLLKDVDGIYERDPADAAPARRFAKLHWRDALAVSGCLIQRKALQFAEKHALPFEVAQPVNNYETAVGDHPPAFADRPEVRPLKVALLGLGTVGFGVYRYLQKHTDKYDISAIAVRDKQKHADKNIPPHLLVDDPWKAILTPCDIVIETIGGEAPAAELISAALERGRSVVTANKAVIANSGANLQSIANANGAQLRYSASVGGGVPVLETLHRYAKHGIRRFDGVINGTCNFVLDRFAEGDGWGDAVAAAQSAGFAEANPGTDLQGLDALHKLKIITKEGFGEELSEDDIRCEGITGLYPASVKLFTARNHCIRLIASCRKTKTGLKTVIAPRLLKKDLFLANTGGEANRAYIETQDGEVIRLTGKGAGRWPTAEAVMADLFDIYRLKLNRPPIRRDAVA